MYIIMKKLIYNFKYTLIQCIRKMERLMYRCIVLLLNIAICTYWVFRIIHFYSRKFLLHITSPIWSSDSPEVLRRDRRYNPNDYR